MSERKKVLKPPEYVGRNLITTNPKCVDQWNNWMNDSDITKCKKITEKIKIRPIMEYNSFIIPLVLTENITISHHQLYRLAIELYSKKKCRICILFNTLTPQIYWEPTPSRRLSKAEERKSKHEAYFYSLMQKITKKKSGEGIEFKMEDELAIKYMSERWGLAYRTLQSGTPQQLGYHWDNIDDEEDKDIKLMNISCLLTALIWRNSEEILEKYAIILVGLDKKEYIDILLKKNRLNKLDTKDIQYTPLNSQCFEYWKLFQADDALSLHYIDNLSELKEEDIESFREIVNNKEKNKKAEVRHGKEIIYLFDNDEIKLIQWFAHILGIEYGRYSDLFDLLEQIIEETKDFNNEIQESEGRDLSDLRSLITGDDQWSLLLLGKLIEAHEKKEINIYEFKHKEMGKVARSGPSSMTRPKKYNPAFEDLERRGWFKKIGDDKWSLSRMKIITYPKNL